MKIFTLFFLFCTILFADNILRIIPPQSEYDSSHNYFQGLLEKVLKNTEDKYEHSNIIYSEKMQQGRAFVELNKKGGLSIHWAGTSKEREDNFIAIKIPLIKGLLGHRKFIINKEKKDIFDNIQTFEDLKKLKPCQGTHWPDTWILENAGIQVVKNTNYELMFLQLQSNRCDYFPRGIHEIVSEVEVRKNKYQNLMIYENLYIYYPFPMYFFVPKNNPLLAKRVEEGLLNLINNGQFDEYMKNHEVTKHIFPLENWINTKNFKLENPFMYENKNINDKKFWIIKE